MLNKTWQEVRRKGNVTVVLQKVKRETKYNSEESGEETAWVEKIRKGGGYGCSCWKKKEAFTCIQYAEF